MTLQGLLLFVIAIFQLVGTPASFFHELIQDQTDHTSKNGNYPQA